MHEIDTPDYLHMTQFILRLHNHSTEISTQAYILISLDLNHEQTCALTPVV